MYVCTCVYVCMYPSLPPPDPQDFTPISALNRDLIIELSSDARESCFSVDITDDDIFEGDTPETFEVQLTLQARRPDDDVQSVTLNPAVSTISIIDDESEIFVGFQRSLVRVDEGDGEVELCVGIMPDTQAGAQFDVGVDLVEEESTAGGSFCSSSCAFISYVC